MDNYAKPFDMEQNYLQKQQMILLERLLREDIIAFKSTFDQLHDKYHDHKTE